MSVKVVPPGMEMFDAANTAAGAMIAAAGSADGSAMTAAAGAAMGPLGSTVYLPSYTGAQSANLVGTLMVAAVHTAIGGATEAAKLSYIATDSV